MKNIIQNKYILFLSSILLLLIAIFIIAPSPCSSSNSFIRYFAGCKPPPSCGTNGQQPGSIGCCSGLVNTNGVCRPPACGTNGQQPGPIGCCSGLVADANGICIPFNPDGECVGPKIDPNSCHAPEVINVCFTKCCNLNDNTCLNGP